MFKQNGTCEKGEKVAHIDQHKAFGWSIDYRKNKRIRKKAARRTMKGYIQICHSKPMQLKSVRISADVGN